VADTPAPKTAPRKKAASKKSRGAAPSARPGKKKAAILALLKRPKGQRRPR
jgi:hypothetical protein